MKNLRGFFQQYWQWRCRSFSIKEHSKCVFEKKVSLDGRKFEGKNCSTLSDVFFAQMGVLVVETQISYAIWINSSWISWSVVGVLYICCRKCQNSGWPPPRDNPGLGVGGQLDLGVSLTIKSHLTKSAFPQSCEPWGPNSFSKKRDLLHHLIFATGDPVFCSIEPKLRWFIEFL